MRFPFLMIKKLILFITVIAACSLSACSSSTGIIANHFDDMVQIAQKTPNDCEKIAASLNDYLNANEASMRKAVANISDSEASDARKIFESSLSLHIATENCKSDSMENFRANLSDIILQSTSK